MLEKSKKPICKIDGCDRDIMYVEQKVCQKHYFRFMRKGYYELEEPKYKIEHSGGYIRVREPNHPLADSWGYVYEHRFVYFEKVSKIITECELCSSPLTWGTVHIDHIDENKKNNIPSNLRELCMDCNTKRNMNILFLTHKGQTKSTTEWAKEDFINVGSKTLIRRKLSGMSDHDSLFHNKGIHFSPRDLEKNKRNKPVVKYSKNRDFISRYYSASEAERQTGIHHGNISTCCHGRVKSAGGFLWEFENM